MSDLDDVVLRFIDGPWQGHTIDWRRPGEPVPHTIIAKDGGIPGFTPPGAYLHVHDATQPDGSEPYTWHPNTEQEQQ